MKSQILLKINNFLRNRLIESFGLLLILVSFFLLASIATYSPSDPNFIYSPESTEIKNIAGFYGSVVSDFLLQSIGLISILIIINFFYWGVKIVANKKINNFITRIFYTLIYIIFGTSVLNSLYNDSFLLIDNGNGGFVGRAIRENIYYFSPIIENEYVIYGFFLLTIIFFILSLSIKLDEIIKIFIFPFVVIKKIFKLLNKNKKGTEIENDNSIELTEQKNLEELKNNHKQPILPFSSSKESKYKKRDEF